MICTVWSYWRTCAVEWTRLLHLVPVAPLTSLLMPLQHPLHPLHPALASQLVPLPASSLLRPSMPTLLVVKACHTGTLVHCTVRWLSDTLHQQADDYAHNVECILVFFEKLLHSIHMKTNVGTLCVHHRYRGSPRGPLDPPPEPPPRFSTLCNPRNMSNVLFTAGAGAGAAAGWYASGARGGYAPDGAAGYDGCSGWDAPPPRPPPPYAGGG